MASLSKRNGKWQARVRRTGHATRAQSFASKADAHRWIRAVEAELDRALIPGDAQRLDDLTVADLLRRYQATVTVKKRGSLYEAKRIDVFLTRTWASLPLSKATAQVFARHRDQRLAQVSPGTVLRELGLLRSIFETAMREWDMPFPENPLAHLKKPRAPEGRDRRLNEGELQALLAPAALGRSEWLRMGILLAIETGMRRSELLNVRWQDIDFTQSVLTIPVTKNGFARRIPLTSKATEILLNERAKAHNKIGRVLPVTANALRLAWERCRNRAARSCPGITELRFHDLRHEAVSRFFEFGLSAAEVALISGHRDMRMLFRYTHLKPESIAAKLRKHPARDQSASQLTA